MHVSLCRLDGSYTFGQSSPGFRGVPLSGLLRFTAFDCVEALRHSLCDVPWRRRTKNTETAPFCHRAEIDRFGDITTKFQDGHPSRTDCNSRGTAVKGQISCTRVVPNIILL